MPIYDVFDRASGDKKYDYTADAPIDLLDLPFNLYEHRERAAVVSAPSEPTSPTEWLIDIGAFFDRFGAAQMAILSSADALVKGVIQNTQVRKWVDLKRPEVAAGLNLLAAKIPAVTPELVAAILTTPVRPDENLALRIMYFGEKNG